MNTFRFFLGALLSGCLLFMSSSIKGTTISSMMNDGDEITLEQDLPNSEYPPRSPEVIPFYAEYQDDIVFLSSSCSLGTVAVELCSTAGDDLYVNFNTSAGSIILPISGEAGYYLLRIIVSPDIHYIGRFEL